ncbi:hypothetical protein G3446_25750 [Thiorhodococcus minor]|uniref:Uncharacterized protein n=1 Tax=Thiorhodococcus minor TaxID=57489 RepID=A0A6M0K926_9GAMM|nr:hypothetical protein [Thiorhodococcus minor]NEV65197.1 hypothetical protein [Thiorhodococcus minor]
MAAEVQEAFIEADAREYADVAPEALETSEQGHGRREIRRYLTLGDLSGVPRSALWEAMNMIGMVESERTINGKTTRETRFHIGSIGTDVETFSRGRCVDTGAWRISCIGAWMSPSTRTPRECGIPMRGRLSR